MRTDRRSLVSAGFTASSHLAEGADDRNGHGTHVAASAAGRTFGVAKSAGVVAVKVLARDGTGSTADIIEGVFHRRFPHGMKHGSAANPIWVFSYKNLSFLVSACGDVRFFQTRRTASS